MRSWKTRAELISGTGLKRSVSTCYKTFSLKEVGDIIRNCRQRLVEKDLPKRKLNPISAYVLDHVLDNILSDPARENDVLEIITIEDSKENGL